MGTTNVTTREPIGIYIPCGFAAACRDVDPAHQGHGNQKAPPWVDMGTTNVTTRGPIGSYIPSGFAVARRDVYPAHQGHGNQKAPLMARKFLVRTEASHVVRAAHIK